MRLIKYNRNSRHTTFLALSCHFSKLGCLKNLTYKVLWGARRGPPSLVALTTREREQLWGVFFQLLEDVSVSQYTARSADSVAAFGVCSCQCPGRGCARLLHEGSHYLLETYSSSSSSFWGGSGAGVGGCFCTILIPPALTATAKWEDLTVIVTKCRGRRRQRQATGWRTGTWESSSGTFTSVDSRCVSASRQVLHATAKPSLKASQ